MPLRLALLLALVLPWLARGADVSGGSTSAHDQQAQQDIDGGNATAAVQQYETAIAADPKSAEPHYELGVLYSDKLHDPINAIYHLRKFIELQPNSDKAPNARAMIDKEGKVFAANLPKTPGE